MTPAALAPTGDVASAAPEASDADVTRLTTTELDRVTKIEDPDALAGAVRAYGAELLRLPGPRPHKDDKAAVTRYGDRWLAVTIAATRLSEHLATQHMTLAQARDHAVLAMLRPYSQVMDAWDAVNAPLARALADGEINTWEYEERTAHARAVKNHSLRKVSPAKADADREAAVEAAEARFAADEITADEYHQLVQQADELRAADLLDVPYKPVAVRKMLNTEASQINYIRLHAAPPDKQPDVPDAAEVAKTTFPAANKIWYVKAYIDQEVRYVGIRALTSAPILMPNSVVSDYTNTLPERISQIRMMTR